MNVLLYSPALAILLILEHGFIGAIKHVSLCAIIQVNNSNECYSGGD